MTDTVPAVATTPEVKAPKVKEPKAIKPKAEPKPPRLSATWTEEKWAAKLATMTVPSKPEDWLIMSEIVKQAVAQDIKRSRICTAMGGDRCANEVWDPIFEVKYVGGRKYGSPEILTKGFALLKDPEFHKPARRGKVKKEGAEGETKAATPSAAPAKLKVTAPQGGAWTPSK